MTPMDRLAGRILVTMLLAGFAYSTVATARQYREWFALPASTGPDASIDDTLAILGPVTSATLRAAVRQAGWPVDEDLAVVGAVASLSENDLKLIHYSVTYSLYPRRVWLATWCGGPAQTGECERRQALSDFPGPAARNGARHVLLVGAANPFTDVPSRRLSDFVSLVDLQ